jgi:hypothetical protein
MALNGPAERASLRQLLTQSGPFSGQTHSTTSGNYLIRSAGMRSVRVDALAQDHPKSQDKAIPPAPRLTPGPFSMDIRHANQRPLNLAGTV